MHINTGFLFVRDVAAQIDHLHRLSGKPIRIPRGTDQWASAWVFRMAIRIGYADSFPDRYPDGFADGYLDRLSG